MSNFIKRMRAKFSGSGQDNHDTANNKIGPRRLPSQKSQSFKTGKRQQNWFNRQLSGGMSQDNYFSDNNEFAAVIAAAAFAINSVEEEAQLQGQRSYVDKPEASLIKIKSRKEPGEASTKDSVVVAEQMIAEDENIKQKAPAERTATRIPTMKRSPTFAITNTNGTGPKQLESAAPQNYRFPKENDREKPRNSTTNGKRAAIADAWEKSELQRARNKYALTNSTIDSWETQKKAKAKQRLDRIEQEEVGKRRERELQHYNDQLSRIDQIANGARAAAEEKRRNEEFKIKAKANKIRETGKVPVKCFCF